MTTIWTILDHRVPALDALGLIPEIILEGDPRPVRDQIADRYAHGGGWHPMPGWTFDPVTRMIHYPGDAPLRPLATATIHNEWVLVYPYAWVCVVQVDGGFEVSRMD